MNTDTETEAQLEETIERRVASARRSFNSSRVHAADQLAEAVDGDMNVTSFECEAVANIAACQASWLAWMRLDDLVASGTPPKMAVRKTVASLLSQASPGNSTGHGHRAFDSRACEGTLRALTEMQDMVG